MPLLLIQALWELPSSRNQGYRKPYDWRAWRALHHTLLRSRIWPGLSPGGGDQSPGPNCFSSWPQQQMIFFMSFRKKTGEATDWTKSPMPGVALKATCSVRDDPECKDALWTRGEQEDPSENTEGEEVSPRSQGMGKVSFKKLQNESHDDKQLWDNMIIVKVHCGIKSHHGQWNSLILLGFYVYHFT